MIEFQKRAIKGKPRITMDEKELLKLKKNKLRDKFEKNNIGDFSLIYPPEAEEEEEMYKKFISVAK